jgi:elongation factor G
MEEKFVSTEKIIETLKSAVAKREVFPVLAGSALKNIGVQNLLNYIAELIPAPIKGNNEFKGLIFKIQSLPNIGLVYYVRVYSGTLSKGSQIYNLTSGKRFRVNRIMKIHVISVTDLPVADYGSIIAVTGIEGVTGDTISTLNGVEKLYPIIELEPVISISIGTKSNSTADYEKLINTLKIMSLQDPSLKFETKEVAGVRQQIISGMGELHLQIIVDMIKSNYGIDVIASEPKVEYKSTFINKKEISYTFKRQTGGSGL